MSPAQPAPDRSRLWLALGALAVVVVAAGIAAAVLLTRGGDDGGAAPTATLSAATTTQAGTTATAPAVTVATVIVPSVVGLRQAAATARLDALRLNVLARSQASPRPGGVVVSQNPGAGSRLARGGLVGLVVSAGRPGVVPAVVGLSAAEAAAKLRSVGLDSRARKVASDRHAGIVAAQSPAAGTKLGRGEVVLSVSSGPPQVAVPDVIGLLRGAALAKLRAAGFSAAIRSLNSARPAGTVLDQAPPGGSTLGRGRAVHLTIARRPPAGTVRVPGVVGLQQATAARRLRAARLRPRAVRVHSLLQVGTVTAQDPAAGTRAAADSRVSISISTGPGP